MNIPWTLQRLCAVLTLMTSCADDRPEISGELRLWHTVTLTFRGPETSESAALNPFTDYRLKVTFTNGNEHFEIPGYYAADGRAAETGADTGNKWRVKFVPNAEGRWRYSVSFRQGNHIAISDDPDAGAGVSFDGATGYFDVDATDKTGKDLRSKGRLVHAEGRYLRFSGSGEYYLKGGTDSPENFLAYSGFDGTRYRGDNEARMGEAKPDATLHVYSGHVADWQPGDPDWHDGKGRGIIGALNYLSSKGMNSVYFLTLNIAGDGEDVWPYITYEDRQRFDCSKLDQWDIVFSHMDRLGIMLHVVTQETENQLLLDNGDTGPERKLYYRELIARFAHHLAVSWNMGEENGYADFSPKAQDRQQQKDMIAYVKTHDPYGNTVVVHTHSSPKYRDPVLDDLLGYEFLDGPSLQIGSPPQVHNETLTWVEKSVSAGRPWVVNLDEIGPANRGVDPDDRTDKNNQDSIRSLVLWGNLMAGGGGTEWYFGYLNHDNDLGCEDWRSRDRMWDYTRFALDFFYRHLRFWRMEPSDGLTANPDDYCFAEKGVRYAIYLPKGRTTSIDLTGEAGTFSVQWYNPRRGGDLIPGTVTEISAGGRADIGLPPSDVDSDWAVLLSKK